MARRRMTLRRIDPWSVLKFGAVVNACLLVIALLGFGILWFAIRQLGVIDQACDLATDVGFESCAINGGNLFRYLVLLGLLWVVIQTGLLVFFAFLHNLIADLVGGVEITLSEEGAATMTSRSSRSERTEERDSLGSPPPRRDEQPTQPRGASSKGTAAAASGSAVAGATSSRSGTSSGGSASGGRSRDLPDRAPSAPPTTAASPAGPQRPAGGGGWPWDPQQPREERTSGTTQQRTPETTRDRSGEQPSQDPNQSERSGSQGGSQDRPDERHRERGEDDLFGGRDR